MNENIIHKLIESRKHLIPEEGLQVFNRENAAEGGCGVIGIASSEKIAGKHMLQSLIQMRNRGNGKGGGIAAAGLNPAEFGVSQQVLDEDYLVAVAYIDPSSREEVESYGINPTFDVDHVEEITPVDDFQLIDGLEIKPPDVVCYFVRIKPEIIDEYRFDNNLPDASQREIEDEIIFQNTFRLNSKFYASTGSTKAFVLSHGKNLLVLKMVGYGDDVIRYYRIEDLHAHIWIGHHRYPTKGRVWHPGGAHPFIGVNEALVHNGDFANYASITEYLSQRNIYPLFLTDTEVSVQVFDLLHRTYRYPLEYVIEAIAPTTERDFFMLPPEKQEIYSILQSTHMHASPDGPWFFLIAQSAPDGKASSAHRLIGITDTSMLRPQVFAIQEHGASGASIGFAASEKQAIDAALLSLSEEDDRYWKTADRYWNARGGSHTDGGAFIFSVEPLENHSGHILRCTDKFGNPVKVKPPTWKGEVSNQLPAISLETFSSDFTANLISWDEAMIQRILSLYTDEVTNLKAFSKGISTLTDLLDRRYPIGMVPRSKLLGMLDSSLIKLVNQVEKSQSQNYRMIRSFDLVRQIKPVEEMTAILDGSGFQEDGDESLARAIVDLSEKGISKFVVFNARGHRFIGNGFGENSEGIRIDVFGSSGDYLGSGIDGAEIYVHGNAQDQLAQIMKNGKLVIYGDVGQTFGYAMKGGEAYILGNAAGRPMINAVGKPRVVINGTCLDYLAESFMAGDPYNGGGFVILNGISFDEKGEIIDQDYPYPGSNLFSLASGGAIFIRDPEKTVTSDQLNGGELKPFEEKDWELILPYLEENERLFNIRIQDLLRGKTPGEVYRKILPRRTQALMAEEAWVRKDH